MYIYIWFGLYYRNVFVFVDFIDFILKFRGRSFYDVLYMFEVREFLRKKFIGKKVRFWIMFYFIIVLCYVLNDNIVIGMVL